MALNRVKISVAGSDYCISSEEDPSYIYELAAQLDSDIAALLAKNPSASVVSATVLCAISYLDESKKALAGADNLRSQMKDYLQDAAKARIEADDSRREAEKLRRQLAEAKL